MRWLSASGMATLLCAAATGAGLSFDHSEFDTLLKAHVADGMVDYDAFAAAPAFKAYLERLARFDPARLPAAERLAYWINVYNAYTIELINRHGERNSIRNINKTVGLKLKGPWREELVAVGGRRYHLDNVEHDIMLLSGRFSLESTPYDWTLNSQQKARELAEQRRRPE